jgi:hypothetical protein
VTQTISRGGRAPAAILLAAFALALAAHQASAQAAAPAPGTPREFRLPHPTELALENGLRVTMVPYGNVPKVDVQLIVRAGNVDEAVDEVWLADLTGDLMEEGTVSLDASGLAEAAASMGGALSVGVGSDQTFVTGTALSEFGPRMVALVADVARSPAFPRASWPASRPTGSAACRSPGVSPSRSPTSASARCSTRTTRTVASSPARK